MTTTQEAGKKGGIARAKNHSKEELSAWAKKGGRPRRKLDDKIKSVSECEKVDKSACN